MPDSPWFLAAVAMFSIFCLRIWWGIFQRMAEEPGIPDETNPLVSRYGRADVIFASFLSGFFILSILADPGGEREVTRAVLINGMLFYSSLLIAMLSFLILRGINPVEVYGLGGDRQTQPQQELGEEVSPTSAPPPAPLVSSLLKGLGWLVIAYPILMLAQIVSYKIAGVETPPQEILLFLLNNPGWADRAALLTLAVVVAPITEEFIFRGYLYGVIRKYGGKWSAIATTSLLFAAIHLHAPSFAGLFLLGALLCLMMETTRRLWVPIVAHAVFNASSVLIALLWPDLLP